jgi:V/A-type H+-transporting ATPase subunit A
MVPYGVNGTLVKIQEGEFMVDECIAEIKTEEGKKVEVTMVSKWEVRRERPYKKKLPPDRPLTTGQRNVDTFSPIAKGGTACIPGPFGS